MKLSDVLLAIGTSLATLAIGAWVSERMKGPAMSSEDTVRKRVVEIARAQLGKKDVQRYISTAAPVYVGQADEPEWCGIFALWALKEAGLGFGVEWIDSKGFLFRLPHTQNPQPGDVAYFKKLQHQAIIAAVRGDEVDLLNGNGKGGVVSASTRPRSEAAAYYSIAPWIADALAKGQA